MLPVPLQLKVLLLAAKRGADFAKPRANQFTPLMLACSTEGQSENAKQILKLCDHKVMATTYMPSG